MRRIHGVLATTHPLIPRRNDLVVCIALENFPFALDALGANGDDTHIILGSSVEALDAAERDETLKAQLLEIGAIK